MIASLAKRIPLSPNTITSLGVLFGLGAFSSLALNHPLESLVWMALLGSCDILDGAVAKATRRQTPFGAFLDSTVDRLTEGFVFLGILISFYRRSELGFVFLTYAALLGSYLVSYTRARGENVVERCQVGFWERPERLCLLMLAVTLGRLPAALWFLTFGSFLTAFHRAAHVHVTLQKEKLPNRGLWAFLFWPYKRFSVPYLLYALAIILWMVLIPV